MEHTIENAPVKSDMGTVVVPDKLITGKNVFLNMLAIRYISSEEKYEEICKAALERVDFTKNSEFSISRSLKTKIGIFEESDVTSTTIVYLAVYVGIIFLITSAAILAIKQLSETSDNIRRYGLLRKIGAEETMINKALLVQIGVYFVVPMFLAVAHALVGITVVNDIAKMFGKLDFLGNSIFTAVVIIVIFGGYFIATYLGSKNIVNKQ